MTLADLLGKLSKKIGIDFNTDEFKDLAAITAEVPKTLSDKLDSELMTIDAAKSNATLVKYFRHHNLSVVDERIAETLQSLGIQDTAELDKITNTFDKVKAFGELVAKAKATAPQNGSEEFAKKEKELQDQLRTLKAEREADKTKHDGELQSIRQTAALEKILAGKKFALPEQMSLDTKLGLAIAEINKDLAAQGFKLKLNEGGLSIVNAEGNPAYGKDNAAIEPNTYFDGVLTRSNILQINKPGDHNPPANGSLNLPKGDEKAPKNEAIANELKTQLANMPD